MPFITKENREKMLRFLESGKLSFADERIEVGDWCFLCYREMWLTWKANPRWTTVHNLYKKMRADIANGEVWFTIPGDVVPARRVSAWSSNPGYINNWDDLVIAYALAWQVFFASHVLKYEWEKREENGEVE